MEDEFRAGRIELLKHAAFFDSDTRWSVSRISRSKKRRVHGSMRKPIIKLAQMYGLFSTSTCPFDTVKM
jgi:hypothetical protein